MGLTPEVIRDIVQKRIGVSLSYRKRDEVHSNARCIYAKLCRDYLSKSYSLAEIGTAIGRDHASIMNLAGIAFTKRSQKATVKKLYLEINEMIEPLAEKSEEQARGSASKVLALETEVELYDNALFQQREKLAELQRQHDKVKESLMDPIFGDIAELSEDQFKTFKERASVMIRSIKSIRTYSNTSKSEFNPK